MLFSSSVLNLKSQVKHRQQGNEREWEREGVKVKYENKVKKGQQEAAVLQFIKKRRQQHQQLYNNNNNQNNIIARRSNHYKIENRGGPFFFTGRASFSKQHHQHKGCSFFFHVSFLYCLKGGVFSLYEQYYQYTQTRKKNSLKGEEERHQLLEWLWSFLLVLGIQHSGMCLLDHVVLHVFHAHLVLDVGKSMINTLYMNN